MASKQLSAHRYILTKNCTKPHSKLVTSSILPTVGSRSPKMLSIHLVVLTNFTCNITTQDCSRIPRCSLCGDKCWNPAECMFGVIQLVKFPAFPRYLGTKPEWNKNGILSDFTVATLLCTQSIGLHAYLIDVLLLLYIIFKAGTSGSLYGRYGLAVKLSRVSNN